MSTLFNGASAVIFPASSSSLIFPVRPKVFRTGEVTCGLVAYVVKDCTTDCTNVFP